MKHLNWRLDETRFLTSREVNRLREETKIQSGKKADTRDWLIIDLALSTGLRLGEIAGLKCGDFMIQEGCSSLIVRHGKGDKSRIVRFGPDIKSHIQQFFSWKQGIGEEIGEESPLLISDRTGKALTRRAIQKTFSRCAKRSGIHGHRFHDMRHTYASHLYKASRYNLRLVQKQLGHSSIAVTEVYADVLGADLKKAVDRLYE